MSYVILRRLWCCCYWIKQSVATISAQLIRLLLSSTLSSWFSAWWRLPFLTKMISNDIVTIFFTVLLYLMTLIAVLLGIHNMRFLLGVNPSVKFLMHDNFYVWYLVLCVIIFLSWSLLFPKYTEFFLWYFYYY